VETVTLTIDGQRIEVPKGTTILKAARLAGIEIPTLCDHPDQAVKAVCRVCIVEIQGQRTFQAACAYPVAEGMVVKTNTPAIREARKLIVELILSRHPQDCLKCEKNLHCELQRLAEGLGIREVRFDRVQKEFPEDHSTPSIVRDPSKCILCRRCVYTCHEVQGVGVLYPINRGKDTIIAPAMDGDLAELACVLCGQCTLVCPTGAITERDDTAKVWAAIADPKKHVVVQTAPATRATLGEEMGLPAGTLVTGKLVAALRRLGFDRVFDTDFTADLTILEEGTELIERIKTGGKLPLLTSCSPGWIKYIEHFYPELLPHLSTCKSPQQMFGALAKSYYAEKAGISPKDIFVVSIMPCTAKKFECQRPEMKDSGYQDVDVVLTSRELGRMMREAGIAFENLPEEEYDLPLGISTGAAAIFGATGGVMEAALRTAYEILTGKSLENIELVAVRGMESIKEATIPVGDLKVKVAVAHGLANAGKLMEKLAKGEADYHFIEVMCCPGGCIGGGGQPIGTDNAIRKLRMDAIYREDQRMPLRKSHENPVLKQLYEEYLGHPLGEKSHHLLHTEYTKRSRY
jgi:NADH-quinone oxidoreductase subunit G/NADP-reducing hydrogenase subunit HndD